ncbi:MAG: TIGR03279 family radical SAM protein [Cyanobacteriota bacterium]|nr:TIGR03279 family radical SAM protein [Cyanobacteriota bacterium]
MSRSTIQPARISRVLPGSLAAQAGIEAGDRLLSVNGQPLRDLIDYQFAVAEEELELEIRRGDGQPYRLHLANPWQQDLGLEFETALFDGLIQCNNACPFCFIDQQPPEMRASLHLKDDDYRLSFLYGSYLTLTNLPTTEWERIAQMRLSPLYISVHATEPEIRARLLKNPRAGLIREQLAWFRQHRLQIHAQVVLCPGWNDGEHLTHTLLDLAGFYHGELGQDPPTVLSVAVVPVGLTRFRPPEDAMTPVNQPIAQQVIEQVTALQTQFRDSLGSTFAWLADEWYLLAGQPLPPASHYEGYPQIGNGVGSLRQFLTDFQNLPLPREFPSPLQATWVVGNAVEPALQPIVERLNRIPNLRVHLIGIASPFWGQPMTVTGLLTGQDIWQALRGVKLGDVLLLPSVTLKDDTTFLDDWTWQDLQAKLQTPVVRVGGGADALLRALLAYTLSPIPPVQGGIQLATIG